MSKPPSPLPRRPRNWLLEVLNQQPELQSDATRAVVRELGDERPAPPVMRAADSRARETVPITEGDVRRDRLRRNPYVQGTAMVARALNVPADLIASVPEVLGDLRTGHPWRAGITASLAMMPFFFHVPKRPGGGEYITGPALRIDGKVYHGTHGQAHVHVLEKVREELEAAARARGVPERHIPNDYYAALQRASSDDEGFITSTGRYVNRTQAMALARENGQLIPGRLERLRETEDDLHAGDLLPPPGAVVEPPKVSLAQRHAAEIQDALFDPKRGGITLDPSTNRPMTGSGYLVADDSFTHTIKATDPEAAREEIQAWLATPEIRARLADPGSFVGGWRNPDTGVIEVNITNLVKDEPAARALGLQRKQHSIGEITDGVYQRDIRLDEPPDAPPAGGLPAEPPPPPLLPPPVTKPVVLPESQVERAAQQERMLEETGQTGLFNISIGRRLLDPERIAAEGAPNIKELERGLPRVTPDLLPDVPRGSVLRPPQVDIARPEPGSRTWRRQRERFRDVIRSEDWLGDIVRGIGRGGDRWYDADRIAQTAIDALGPEEGMRAFEEWARAMGPTSLSTPPVQNLRQAGWWFGQSPERIRAMARAGEAPPPGFGGLYPTASTQHVSRYLFEPTETGANKMRSYVENILGNWRPGTIDRHEVRRMRQILGLDNNPNAKLPPTAYSAVETEMQDFAGELADQGILDVPVGREPTAPAQAARWTGGAEATGVRGGKRKLPTLEDIFNRAIFRTSVHTGLDPEEVIRRFWRKQLPLLGGAGLLGAGAVQEQQENSLFDF